ncbi:MAG: ABC transporter permease [Methanobrevibacter sp.]|nr:ABC transporter permease [Methanobrevibacter sp.]
MKFMSDSDLFLLEEVVKKNFSAKYKDSVLGILWSVIKPLCMMIILTVVFSTLFSRVGNYPVFLLSARCIFNFFTGGVGVTMLAIKGNKYILQKNPVPKYIFILGGIISEFINFLIAFIILIGVMIVTNNPFYLNYMVLAIIPVVSMTLIIAGLGLSLSILTVYFTDMKHLWGVITFMFMYGCGIFYPMDIVPHPYRDILILNPIYWIIVQFRDFIMYGVMPDTLNLINTILISLIIFVFGVIVFKKYEKQTTLKL